MTTNNKALHPLEQILDGTNQLIQICDSETLTMLYANKSARNFSPHPDQPYEGEPCYKYMRGLDEQCPYCPIRQMINQDSISIEVDNGHQVFSVSTKRIQWDNKECYVEYASDITAIRRAQATFDSQMKKLVDSIPEAQGIFHINLTKDLWLSSNGVSQILEELRRTDTVNGLVDSLVSYIPEKEMRDQVYGSLCRESLIEAYSHGKSEVSEETLSYYDDGSIRWSKITARLIPNPTTGDLEGIIYGMDISSQKKYQEELERAEHEKALILAKTKQDILTGVYNKKAFVEIANEYISVCPKQSFAIIFLDLDNFKAINDNFGHLVGDQVIIETAETLQTIYSNKDIISRFGGDEYCLLIKNIPYERLLDKLEFTLQKLDKTYREGNREVNVTASIGVAFCDGKAKDITEWIEMADVALYRAKRGGRNQYQIIEGESTK